MAEEFSERDLTGARFERVDLSGASFDRVSLAGARFREVDMSGVRIRGAFLDDVVIDGGVRGVRVNGIEIAPMIEAELDRLHPERAKLRPTDAAGCREAWTVIEELWAETVDRARQLDAALLHERHRHQRGVVAPPLRRTRPRRVERRERNMTSGVAIRACDGQDCAHVDLQ